MRTIQSVSVQKRANLHCTGKKRGEETQGQHLAQVDSSQLQLVSAHLHKQCFMDPQWQAVQEQVTWGDLQGVPVMSGDLNLLVQVVDYV